MNHRKTAFALCSHLILTMCLVLPTQAQAPPAEPTAEHALLAKDVGTWDAEAKYWVSPDTAPVVSKGVEKNAMMGGLWLVSHFKSATESMPYEGRGQIGYDPVSKKFVGTYVDSMSPYLFTMEGSYDKPSKSFTMMSTGRDMFTGKITTTKNITRYIDEDTRVFEIHEPVAGQEGKWRMLMEIKYKRKK